jgi:hypothetical protein
MAAVSGSESSDGRSSRAVSGRAEEKGEKT